MFRATLLIEADAVDRVTLQWESFYFVGILPPLVLSFPPVQRSLANRSRYTVLSASGCFRSLQGFNIVVFPGLNSIIGELLALWRMQGHFYVDWLELIWFPDSILSEGYSFLYSDPFAPATCSRS